MWITYIVVPVDNVDNSFEPSFYKGLHLWITPKKCTVFNQNCGYLLTLHLHFTFFWGKFLSIFDRFWSYSHLKMELSTPQLWITHKLSTPQNGNFLAYFRAFLKSYPHIHSIMMMNIYIIIIKRKSYQQSSQNQIC